MHPIIIAQTRRPLHNLRSRYQTEPQLQLPDRRGNQRSALTASTARCAVEF
jgi:hypothetical protein